MRSWEFTADMNGDLAVTISDVWLWIKWLYFYPGDSLVATILKGLPSVAAFFEMSESSYGGAFAGIVSIPLWFLMLFMVFSRDMWVAEDYDPSKPFWKRAYGFWPSMFMYVGALGVVLFIITSII